MDPLGAAASILAIIQLTAVMITLSKDYIDGVKGASEEAQQLVDELKSLGKVLSVLHSYVVNDRDLKSTALQALNGQNGPISTCSIVLKRLQLKLEPEKERWGKINLLKWPLKEQETLKYIAQIERDKSLFNLALSIDQLNLSKVIEAKTDDTNHVVHILEAGLSAQLALEENKKRGEILNWLHSEEFERKHLEISGRRQSNTGEWLLQAPEFKDWVNQQSKLIWGYGIPGAGKTYLSSLVIDHFVAQAPTENYGVAYVYFDYMDRDRQRPINILSSLVSQLANQKSHLPKEIEEMYHSLGGEKKTHLRVVIRGFPCGIKAVRSELLPLFHRLKDAGMNIFLKSRPYPEGIHNSLHDMAKIELSAKDVDIGIYVRQRIEGNPRARCLVMQGKFEDTVVSTIVDCAKGIEMLKELENLQSSTTEERPLDPAYDRVIENLRKQSKNCVTLALNVLSWLVKAKRILTIDELRHAVSVKPGQTEIDEWDLPDKTTLLDVCASMVTIYEKNGTIRLAHYTVQEYLLRKCVLPMDSSLQLALACITYLSFDTFAQGALKFTNWTLMETGHRIYPFLGYAADSLGSHLKACDEALTADGFVMLLGDERRRRNYLQAQTNAYYTFDEVDQPGLNIASSIGHYVAVTRILDAEANISLRDRRGFTALYEAVFMGHDTIVRLLLDKRANPSAPAWDGDTPLHLAVSKGYEAIVQLLLDKGADLSMINREGETPLDQARSEAIRRLLLGKEAALAKMNIDGGNALELAEAPVYEELDPTPTLASSPM